MSLPKISIITPSYNQGRYIKATIDSVLSQGYPDLEYIVMDGGSTDDTVKILKSYGDQIQWVSKRDKGQTDAINRGLKMSTGEVLAYLNSDDILVPGALKRVGEYYAHTQADWMTGDCDVIDEQGRVILSHNLLVRTYKRLLLKLYSPWLLRVVDNMLPQPSTFWSHRAYKRIGEFDERLNYVMDYDYWLRMSRYYRPHDLRAVLSGFRAQPESKSETSREQLMAEGNVVLAKNGASKIELSLHRIHSNVMRVIYNLLKKDT